MSLLSNWIIITVLNGKYKPERMQPCPEWVGSGNQYRVIKQIKVQEVLDRVGCALSDGSVQTMHNSLEPQHVYCVQHPKEELGSIRKEAVSSCSHPREGSYSC